MIEKQISTDVYGEPGLFTLRFYNEEDIPWLKTYFEAWKTLYECTSMEADNEEGLHHDERSPNLPEGISETMYCMITTCGRYYKPKPKNNPTRKVYKTEKLESRSFDAFDVVNNKTVQVKATQVKNDCTTFGPKSKWDELVFMDFYNNGNIDGTVDVYSIPTDLVHKVIVCKYDEKKGETDITFLRQQELQRRPRFSVKNSIIKPHNIQPIYKQVKLW
jgi:hypothetical protein